VKLATFVTGGQARVGAVVPGGILDLDAAARRAGPADEAFASMLALIDAGDAGTDRARRLAEDRGDEVELLFPIDTTELLAPLPEPRQMRDAMSFAKHILQAPRGSMIRLARERGDLAEAERLAAEPLGELPAVYRQVPIYYFTNRFSVRGHGATVRWPRYSQLMDYELELAIVTRGRGADIPVAKAGAHIFGYTIFNDFSARDRQMIEMAGRLGPMKGKSFDGGNVLGPWIVTPDEIGDPQALRMQARVNGETRCDTDSSGMLRSFEELIAYISQDETLMPGEVIGSGTVGDGCGLEHARFLDDGDVVELEIEKIGVLRNRVVRQDPG
jgi:2-keto-4-pentenoate hydratase/2-oxohepta-3-ene-1,7-dioic acid hydratase in catechol pathway